MTAIIPQQVLVRSNDRSCVTTISACAADGGCTFQVVVERLMSLVEHVQLAGAPNHSLDCCNHLNKPTMRNNQGMCACEGGRERGKQAGRQQRGDSSAPR